MLYMKACIRLLQLFWRHFCLPNHHKHVIKSCCLCTMPWSLSCMPCKPQFQVCCKPCLEDLHSQDKFLNIPLVADWHTILACREKLVNDALLYANKKHINFDYQIGQKVFKYDKTLQGQLKPKTTGPFDILWVHWNGTLTIHLQPGIA